MVLRTHRNLQWLTTHDASTEHDLSGLRDNFNPRARWKAAIAGARALSRFGSANSRTSTSSKSSGGWKTKIDTDDSDDDDDDEVADPQPVPQDVTEDGPGQNDFVTVTAPDDDKSKSKDTYANGSGQVGGSTPDGKPSDAHELKREHDAHEPLEKKVPEELHQVNKETEQAAESASAASNGHADHIDNDDDDEEELRMPGSFNFKQPPHHHGHHGLADFFRKMHIKSH